jgi:NAD(P)-dependent dehydrogenase (short-subunit alcohol dehydrogenase family)
METPSQLPRVWLITGCSTGMGRALAIRTLDNGDRVLATARNPATLNELVERHPESCKIMALDVTDSAQVEGAVRSATDEFGSLEVLVNNAGYGLIGAFEELGREQIVQNFQADLFGAMELIRVALPILRAQGSGRIVNISAAAAIANYPGFSVYGATKWALEGLSETLAAELKPLGIHVTIVQPGPFRTDFINRSLKRAETHIADYDRTSGKSQRLIESMDGKQIGDPGKAAEAIIAAVASENPPLRLVLGKYAIDKVRKKLVATANELATWEHIGLPTDFQR